MFIVSAFSRKLKRLVEAQQSLSYDLHTCCNVRMIRQEWCKDITSRTQRSIDLCKPLNCSTTIDWPNTNHGIASWAILEEGPSLRHKPTVPIESGPRRSSHIKLVPHASWVYLTASGSAQPQPELQCCTKTIHRDTVQAIRITGTISNLLLALNKIP